MSKRLLIITCHRLCDNNGGANASKGFIHCFASLFDDCSLIFPEFDNPKEFLPDNIKLFPCHDSRPKIMKGLDMYRGVVNALYSCVREHLKNHKYDVIVVDHSVTGTGIIKSLKATGANLITIHHNVERDYLRDNGNERPVTFRYPYNFFAKRAERDCLKHSDVNLTLTDKDAETFSSWYKDLHLHCVGIAETRDFGNSGFRKFGNSETRKFESLKVRKFVISGSLCFLQSLQPIIEFMDVFYPILKAECPECRLIIAGRNPSQKLYDACDGLEDVQIIANPENMDDIIRDADYYICPINAGSGIKLRVMDGLRQGLPVLCHKISENGYETLSEKGFLFAYDDVASFKESLRKLLSCNVSPTEVYAAFRERFSMEAVTLRLQKILQDENIL